MEPEQAQLLRRAWQDAGDLMCPHYRAEPESYKGIRTGDFICITCGEDFTREEWQTRQQRQRSTPPPATIRDFLALENVLADVKSELDRLGQLDPTDAAAAGYEKLRELHRNLWIVRGAVVMAEAHDLMKPREQGYEELAERGRDVATRLVMYKPSERADG